MKIISKLTGEILGEIVTYHRLTLEEAITLIGTKYNKIYDDDPDYIINDIAVFYDDLDLVD